MFGLLKKLKNWFFPKKLNIEVVKEQPQFVMEEIEPEIPVPKNDLETPKELDLWLPSKLYGLIDLAKKDHLQICIMINGVLFETIILDFKKNDIDLVVTVSSAIDNALEITDSFDKIKIFDLNKVGNQIHINVKVS